MSRLTYLPRDRTEEPIERRCHSELSNRWDRVPRSGVGALIWLMVSSVMRRFLRPLSRLADSKPTWLE
ncbi:hypothetical protein GHK28_08945 [Sinorhizobium medicae]|nr:hypothetical protein [Sinorhizobium medicae]MQV55556.1 hypothetical protein [Sinorhizobium medicae]MQV72078.1 hypothetical protein [Sinorhizobium medicae]